MMIDDDRPDPKPKRVQPLLLEGLGIEELRDYIADLNGEIARAETEIARKQAHRSAADSFFKIAPGE